MKKNLNENSFSAENAANYSDLTPEQLAFIQQMQRLGFDYQGCFDVNAPDPDKENPWVKPRPGEGWTWIRRHPLVDSWNFKNKDDLIAMQLEAYKKFYANQSIPGTKDNGISVEAYNLYAKWDLWRGGYVSGHGYVSVPSSSAYGAPIILSNSWAPQGGAETPLPEYKFYKLHETNTWSGGYIDNWGYVAQNRRILGNSTDMGFIRSDIQDCPLANIANFARLMTSSPVDAHDYKVRFAAYWNKEKDTYEIDTETLRTYFNSIYYASPVNNIQEALKKHDGVFLRVVTRTENTGGIEKSFGNDYVILSYNIILQVYQYYDPVTGRLGTLDALKIDNGTVKTVKFFFQRNNS